MEEVYEAQRRRLASDWQWLEHHQAYTQAALRTREAELDKSRRLLQCERDEEIAAVRRFIEYYCVLNNDSSQFLVCFKPIPKNFFYLSAAS